MHHIADHVAEQAHCEADGNNKHIHGEEFAAHHCHLCAIQISKYFPQEFELAATKPNFLLSNIIYESQVFIPHSPAFSYQQRGPPLSAKA